MNITPLCVFGGFRICREDWTRTEDGWECDYDVSDLDETIYPTKEACEQAIIEQHGEAA